VLISHPFIAAGPFYRENPFSEEGICIIYEMESGSAGVDWAFVKREHRPVLLLKEDR